MALPCAIFHRTFSTQHSYNNTDDIVFSVTVFNRDVAGVVPTGGSYAGGSYRTYAPPLVAPVAIGSVSAVLALFVVFVV